MFEVEDGWLIEPVQTVRWTMTFSGCGDCGTTEDVYMLVHPESGLYKMTCFNCDIEGGVYDNPEDAFLDWLETSHDVRTTFADMYVEVSRRERAAI